MKISVIMPVYNCAQYLDESIGSICQQSFRDFEFLILDDASTDQTWDKVNKWAEADERIRLFRNQTNQGIARSLNTLIDESKGKYLARMDADDIAMPGRFEDQVSVLDANQADLCGGLAIIHGAGREFVWGGPSKDEEIRIGLYFGQMFSHATVMFKREVLGADRYDPAAVPAEDYELWLRLAARTKMYNIPRPLVRYRRHPEQISTTATSQQRQLIGTIATAYLERAGLKLDGKERSNHIALAGQIPAKSLREVCSVESLLIKVLSHFGEQPAACKVIGHAWYKYCVRAGANGPGVFLAFVKSPLRRRAGLERWRFLAVGLVSFLRLGPDSALYRRMLAASPGSRI